jgi:hypothetical protein
MCNHLVLYPILFIIYHINNITRIYNTHNIIRDPAGAATMEFEDLLTRIGFGPMERAAIIEMSGCRNIAMLGLLTIDQVSKVCKRQLYRNSCC